ncbi:MAG: hypothetical protein RL341_2013 [Pseudomonadota bacterium]
MLGRTVMIKRFRSSLCIGPMLAAALLCIMPPLAAQPPGEYRIVNGRVDRGTYIGWRLFHTNCYGCHGVGAVGTDIAPNLVERVKTLTPRAFATKVLTSYRIVQPEKETGSEDPAAARDAMIEEVLRQNRNAPVRIIMPAWEADADIKPHVLDLYAYLLARADGKLGPGKPVLLREKKR